jgi:APA family basic amino acid/polyamine antiporter
MNTPKQTEHAGFKRELKLFDSTMLVVGSMVGSGIFVVTADIARTMGSAGWILVVWAVSGVMTLIPALSSGELATLFPKAGGQYVYLRETYNSLIGFLYGWTLFLIIQCGTIAAIAVVFAKYTGELIPWFSEKHILLTIAGLNISAAQLLAVASIALLTWYNMRGLHGGKLIQDWFTIIKIGLLLALIAAGLIFGFRHEVIAANFSNWWSATWTTVAENGTVTSAPLSGMMFFAAFGVASVGSLFAFDAWNAATFTSGETVDPRRTVARSLALGTGIVVVLYLLTNLSYLALLPIQGVQDAKDVMGRGMQFAESDRVATAAVSQLFGGAAAMIVAVCVMISTFGCNNGIIFSGARVYYAMAQDGVFFKKAGELNTKAVPGVGLAVQGIWSAALCLSGKYGDLLDYVMFATVVFYVLNVFGIFIMRKRDPSAERPFRAPGYPYLQILYIAFAVAFCLNLLVYKPYYSWPGLIIVLLGVPVYYLWKRGTAHEG